MKEIKGEDPPEKSKQKEKAETRWFEEGFAEDPVDVRIDWLIENDGSIK